jgi:hypothetical protein
MPRGGRRPGAGAPRGNLNRLQHGHYSPRVRGLAQQLIDEPDVRTVLRVLSHGSLLRLPLPQRAPARKTRRRFNQRILQKQIQEKVKLHFNQRSSSVLSASPRETVGPEERVV